MKTKNYALAVALSLLSLSSASWAFEIKITAPQIPSQAAPQTAPAPAPAPAPAAVNERAWFCTVKAFMDTFEAFGPTKFEATRNVQASCQAKNHEMHCKDVNCQENR